MENALLRQLLLVLHRRVKRPRLTALDRGLIVLFAGQLRRWAQVLLIVQPATVLRWHRQGFRLFWRRKSAPRSGKTRLPAETVALIRRMADENRLWGADRIREELLKLGVRVSKRAIQKHMRPTRPSRPAGQLWSAFVRNHAADLRACDFLPLSDLWFRPLYALFIIALDSRRVVHVGVTWHPTDTWVGQQLREATPFGQRPRYLIRDNDNKDGAQFDRLAAASGMRVVHTSVRAPRANATCERFLGSVRWECLEHVLVLGEPHLRRVLRAYVAYFNHARPHQGIGQVIPAGSTKAERHGAGGGRVVDFPILGGLHYDYRRAA